jgi:hypothetical protein
VPLFNWQNSAIEIDADVERWGSKQWETLAARYVTASGVVGMDDWTKFVPRRRNLWVTAGVSDPFQLGTVGVFCRWNRRISADLHRRDRSAAHRIRSS